MTVPIIWTIISVVVIALTIYSQLFNIYGILLIFFAVACCVLQWLVYFRNNPSGR